MSFQDEGLRNWVITLIGVIGMIRSGELMPTNETPFNPYLLPTRSDVSTDKTTRTITLNLPATKTDRMGAGTKVTIPCTTTTLITTTRCSDHTCPACMLNLWLERTNGDTSDHLFSINGEPYKKATYISWLKQTMQKIGVNPALIGGHSLRIGGASAAHAAGIISSEIIMMIGRWTSDAYQRYVRADTATLTEHIRRIAKQKKYSREVTDNDLATWANRQAAQAA